MYLTHTKKNISTRIPSDELIIIFYISGCLDGGFSFNLWDGKNLGEKVEFKIKIDQLSLTKAVNKELVVFPGIKSMITNEDLEIQASDLNSQE